MIKKASSFILLMILVSVGMSQPQVMNGYSQFIPSNDSRIIYVSDVDGNDATAQYYLPSATEVGIDPFVPIGNIKPYKTIQAAMAQLRNGYPDWILLKNGDVFTNQNFGIITLSGRGLNEPMLFSSYGSNNSTQRPQVLTGTQNGIGIGYYAGNNTCNYIALSGIYLRPHTRSGTDEPAGVMIYADFNSILIEDCYFTDFFNHITILDPSVSNSATRNNLAVRRSIFTNAYTTGNAHANAMFIDNVNGILFEENIIDHNGWKEGVSGSTPTGFRHNSYFQVHNQNLHFSKNIVSRAAATGGGHRCGGEIDNNLYLKNSHNLQFGTFETTINWPAEYVTGSVYNNVILDAQKQSFDEGRGITIAKAKNAEVYNNIISGFSDTTSYTYGISLNTNYENIDVHDNIIYDVVTNNTGSANGVAISFSGAESGTNTIHHNQIQQVNSRGICIQNTSGFTNISFADNVYYSSLSQNNYWFDPGNTLSGWVSQSNETNATAQQINYLDPGRTISDYMDSIGLSGGLNEFIMESVKQSKGNWDDRFTADAVNCYIRKGFQVDLNLTYVEADTILPGQFAALTIGNLPANYAVSFGGGGFGNDSVFIVAPSGTTSYSIQVLDSAQLWLMCDPFKFTYTVVVSGPTDVSVSNHINRQVQIIDNGVALLLSNQTAIEQPVEIYNNLGQIIYIDQLPAQGEASVSKTQFSEGLYIIHGGKQYAKWMCVTSR